MKPPFSYYGGKQRMASKIVKLLPKHTVYVEPFAGSCAILFAKPWPKVTDKAHYSEVINDTNGHVVNFFRQLRDNPDELIRLCSLTPYSQEEHQISKDLDIDDDLERARMFYAQINQSFSNRMNSGWSTAVYGKNHPVSWINRNSRLAACAERLIGTYIACEDAIRCIERWDSPQTLFYCDPPYPGTNQGHYSGYTAEDFVRLVDALDKCSGSFLLSCYAMDVPDHWEVFEFDAYCSASGSGQTAGHDRSKRATDLGNRRRTEVVYRVIRDDVRPEIRALYDSGVFNCFEGEKSAPTTQDVRQQELFEMTEE